MFPAKPTLVERLAEVQAADPPPDALPDYRRAMLKGLLPAKFWKAIEAYGEPDVNADPELQSVAASHCAYVIIFVVRHHQGDLDRDKLNSAQRKETETASLFLRLAQARAAIVTTLEPPLQLGEVAAELSTKPRKPKANGRRQLSVAAL